MQVREKHDAVVNSCHGLACTTSTRPEVTSTDTRAWPNHASPSPTGTWSVDSRWEHAQFLWVACHHAFHGVTNDSDITTLLDSVAPLLAICNTSDWVRTDIKRYVYNLEEVVGGVLDKVEVEAAYRVCRGHFRRDLGVVRPS